MDNPVQETIDERILKLLGLEDEFEMSYEEYIRHLREAMIAARMVKSKYSNDESELFDAEFKRIRGKKGRFRIRKKKVSTTRKTVPTKQRALNFIRPDVKQKTEIKDNKSIPNESILSIIVSIRKSVDSIYKILIDQSKLISKISDSDRKRLENERRAKKENKLESVKDALFNTAKKIIAPIEGILDRIKRFIIFTLLGRAFKLFMDWTSDPANKKKVEVLGRFIKDWWPALLGAFMLFATPLGGFVRAIIGTVTKLTFQLAKFAIPRIAKFAMANPIAATAIGVGAATGIAAGAGWMSENKRKEDIAKKQNTPKEDNSIWGSIGNAFNPGQLGMGGVSALNKGGSVFSGIVDNNTGTRVSGAGPDTQFLPIDGGGGAVLQKGESVLQVGARERMIKEAGIDPLAYNVGSNANKPRTVAANVLANSYGGLVGFNKGGTIGGETNLLKPQARTIFDRLVKGGLTPNAAAGIVSNIGVETGYTYDPNTHQRGGGPGRGLVQWEKGGRFDTDRINLMSFAKSRGTPWNNLNTQTDFILHELNTHPEYQKVKTKINNAKDIPTATNIFLREYEKAGTPHIEDRLKVAQQIMSSGYLKPKKSNRSQPTIMDRISGIMSSITRGAYAKPQKKEGGGRIVGESDGMNIPGGTADRQLLPLVGGGTVAVQPGEGIVPRDVMQNFGEDNFNRFIAMFESGRNSNAAKLGYTKPKINVPQPPIRANRGKMASITLPPISQSSSDMASGGGIKSPSVPQFSAVSSSSHDVRKNHVDIYGIVG